MAAHEIGRFGARRMTATRRLALVVAVVAAVLAGVTVVRAPTGWSQTPVSAVDKPAGGTLRSAYRIGPPGCDRVAIVGDSLTAAAAGFHRTELARAEMVGVVDGRTSRRITGDPLTSGVPTALKIRQEFGEADCWVIGLGTNDIYADATSVAASTRLVEQMLDVLSPYARVWWVNVGLRPIGDPPPDPLPDPVIVARAQWFNQALAQRAAWDGNFRVVDWATLSAANPTWWLDHVHVDRDGSRARAAQVAAAIAD